MIVRIIQLEYLDHISRLNIFQCIFLRLIFEEKYR